MTLINLEEPTIREHVDTNSRFATCLCGDDLTTPVAKAAVAHLTELSRRGDSGQFSPNEYRNPRGNGERPTVHESCVSDPVLLEHILQYIGMHWSTEQGSGLGNLRAVGTVMGRRWVGNIKSVLPYGIDIPVHGFDINPFQIGLALPEAVRDGTSFWIVDAGSRQQLQLFIEANHIDFLHLTNIPDVLSEQERGNLLAAVVGAQVPFIAFSVLRQLVHNGSHAVTAEMEAFLTQCQQLGYVLTTHTYPLAAFPPELGVAPPRYYLLRRADLTFGHPGGDVFEVDPADMW